MRMTTPLLRSCSWLLTACSLVSFASDHPASTESPRGSQVAAGTGSSQSSEVAPVASAGHELTREDLEVWLDGYFPYALEQGDVAGAVIVIVKDGQVLFEKGYGYADVANKTPVDPTKTLFRPGSVSKLFTWTAVMQQVELGRVNLDADVNTYLDIKIPPRDGKPVTMRNLMTHTGGFEETIKYGETDKPAELLPLDQYTRTWIPERIYAPGEVPAYSNYGASLAGYIVERVSGERFDAYVQHHIFIPLAMESSTFVQPLPERFHPRMAQGYLRASSPPKPYQLIGFAPAGALAATGDDMAHFMIGHLQDGAYGQGRILRTETAQLMHDTPLTILPEVHRMLLGFYEMNLNGHRIIGHGGDLSLFHSGLYLYPDDGVGLFVSVNSTGRDGAAYAIREALFDSFTDRYFPGPTPDGRVDARMAKADAGLIAGEYVNSRRSQSNFLSVAGLLNSTTVTDNGDGTISVSGVQGINGQTKQWREIAPRVWRETAGKQRLAARVENGKVTLFSFDEISPFMVYQPVSSLSSPANRLTLLELALAVLLVTVILWPSTALIRRHYGALLHLARHDASAYRAARIAALLVLATLLGWALFFMGLINGSLPITAQTDGWLIALHGLSIITFIGALPLAIWNAWRTWRGPRGWGAKLWSLLLVGAFAVVLWLGLAYDFVGFGLSY